MTPRHVFVAGCGFLGLQVARLLHERGWRVTGCTHSAESAAALQGEPFEVLACDLSNRESLRAAADLAPFDAAIHCASSGKGGAEQYRRVYLEGVQNLRDVLRPNLLLFTSSTSVYAQTDGRIVNEESLAEPARETGQLLRAAEGETLQSDGTVARLAGIYGPKRSVLLRKFLAGEAVIEGDGSRWLNQVHRDDAATAVVKLAEANARGIFNVSDDTPLSQRELYAEMARRLHRPLPPSGPIDPNRKRGWTHKRVANTKLRQAGWAPKYPSYFDAWEELLAAEL